nr:hypothetical protein [uncultured Desulfobulbus sp.]
MSGTVAEVEGELRTTYGLRVRPVALHRPCIRQVLPAKIYKHAQEKWQGVVREVQQMQQQGRPVLIGTGSVAESEQLSQMLQAAGVVHQVLNARQDRAEAAIVASAGEQGQVTVATNMAGRGTDIPLGPGVVELGGLHVIATCVNDAARVDRQLIGRCGRQGDPGSCRSILSLDDQLLREHGSILWYRLLRSSLLTSVPGRHRFMARLFRSAQSGCERRHKKARRALLQSEEAMNRLLAFSGEAL